MGTVQLIRISVSGTTRFDGKKWCSYVCSGTIET